MAAQREFSMNKSIEEKRDEAWEYIVVNSKLYGEKKFKVDLDFYDLLSTKKWSVRKYGRGFYAYFELKKTGKKRNFQSMHRLVLNPKPTEFVDHINGDPQDNRKTNLRICSLRENSCNKKKYVETQSKFKGVTPLKNGKFRVQVKYLGKYYILHSGLENEIDAATLYDIGAIKYFGQFANTNFDKNNYKEHNEFLKGYAIGLEQANVLVEALENIEQIDIDTHKRHPEYEGQWSEYADVARKALKLFKERVGHE